MDDDFAINTVARAIQYVAVVENLVEVPDDYTRTQELANLWIAALAALTLIIGAAYTLWMVKRVMFGEVANANVAALKDIDAREALVLGAFAVGVLVFGLYPKPLTDLMDVSIAQLAAQLAASKL